LLFGVNVVVTGVSLCRVSHSACDSPLVEMSELHASFFVVNCINSYLARRMLTFYWCPYSFCLLKSFLSS